MKFLKIVLVLVLTLIAMALPNPQHPAEAAPFYAGGGLSMTTTYNGEEFEGSLPAMVASGSYLLGQNFLFDLCQERLQDGEPDVTRLTCSYVYGREDIVQKFYIGGGAATKWQDVTHVRIGPCVVGGILWPSDNNTMVRIGAKYAYFGGTGAGSGDALSDGEANLISFEVGYVLVW